MILTYSEALEHFGNRYQLRKAVAEGRLQRCGRGLYSTDDDISIIASVTTQYPDAVLTGTTALYLYGFIDMPPEQIDVATKRGGTKIPNQAVKQTFTPVESLDVGKSALEVDGQNVPTYDMERMLLELMRIRNKIPYDLYREAVQSYRKRADELDIYKLQDYAATIPRGNSYLERAMKEVF